MSMSSSLQYILDCINRNRKIILLEYTPMLYSLVGILEKEFGLIRGSFVFKKWLFILSGSLRHLNRRRLCVKIYNLKSKKCFLSLKKLKRYIVFNPYIIVHSSKGLCSARKAVERKTGGALYCMIYYVYKCS